jgi:hypothetical protein
MAAKRGLLHAAMLAALLMAPSAVSAATPLPSHILVEGSPLPVESSQPAPTVSNPPAAPEPSVAAAPRPTATPQPSAAQARSQPPTALLASNPVPSTSRADRPRARDRTRPRPSRTSSAAPSRTANPAATGKPVTAPPPATQGSSPDALPLVLLWAIAAVGAASLIGSTWLLVARRREPAVASNAAGGDELLARGSAGYEQRALRRARLRQDEDPILAGLGLDDEAKRVASPRSRRGGRPRP